MCSRLKALMSLQNFPVEHLARTQATSCRTVPCLTRQWTACKEAGDGSIDFASFLNIMHEHSQVEDKQKELRAALVAHDRTKKGYVDAGELKHILTSMGEKLTSREVDTLLREAGMQSSGPINISKFVETVMTPQPDY
ncbi:calmodulin [Elysia marginata]|uniref:Calmodulin n=1 Tax=Elysia marginata TaxID=1093978 RepID=A0AAV4EW73_9GAST|nr:calmodulin [Elysia marginata]